MREDLEIKKEIEIERTEKIKREIH